MWAWAHKEPANAATGSSGRSPQHTDQTASTNTSHQSNGRYGTHASVITVGPHEDGQHRSRAEHERNASAPMGNPQDGAHGHDLQRRRGCLHGPGGHSEEPIDGPHGIEAK